MNINASMEKYYTISLSLGEEVVSRNYRDYFLSFENICIFLDMLYLLFIMFIQGIDYHCWIIVVIIIK